MFERLVCLVNGHIGKGGDLEYLRKINGTHIPCSRCGKLFFWGSPLIDYSKEKGE